MPTIFFAATAFFIYFNCHGQKDSIIKNTGQQDIIDYVEYEPSFPGGSGSMKKFLFSRFIIPDSLLETPGRKIYGTIVASFLVNKDGTLSEFEIVKGVHPALDKEWLRVLLQMPKWKPAMQNGIIVKSWYRLSVRVDIPGD